MLYQLSYRKAVQERNKWPLYLLKYHCILVFLCRCEHNLPFVFVQQKGRKCSRTQKSPEPLRLRYAGCRSTRLYRPNYCGTCLDGRCCSPRRTRTAPCCSPAPTESTSRGPSCLCSPVNATTNVATWTMRRSRPNVGCMATCTSLLINILFVQRPAPCLSPSNRVAFRSVTLSRR